MPTITHRFVSAIAESSDLTKVRTSNWNDYHEIANFPFLVSSDFNFTAQAPGGSLTAGITNIITLSPVPKGINGFNLNHPLRIDFGTGTAETVFITGGTAVSEASSGTITFIPANAHSGSWTIKSATAGIQEAIYYGGGSNVKIKVPFGDYWIYGAIRINGSRVVIKGEGTYCTRLLYFGATTSNIFELSSATNGEFNAIIDIGVLIAGVTMTAGWGVYTLNQTYLKIVNFFGNGVANGIYLEGTVVADIYKPWFLHLKPATGVGIYIKNSTIFDINDVIVDHFFCNSAVLSGDGIYIRSCGYVSFNQPSCLTCTRGIVLAPGNGETIASADINFGYFDHCGTCGILFGPSGNGNIVRASFSNCWSGSCVGHGAWINLGGTGTYSGIHFHQCKIYDNGGHGFVIDGSGTLLNTNIVDCVITGNSAAPLPIGDSSGITVLGNCTDLKITNNRIGPADGFTDRHGYAIFINSGITCEGLTITDNNIAGNTVGQISDSSSGTVKIVERNKGVSEISLGLASAGALNIGAGHYEKIELTGTTTITSITPVWKGRELKFTPTNAAGLTIGGSGTIPRTKVLAQYESYTLEYNGTVWY